MDRQPDCFLELDVRITRKRYPWSKPAQPSHVPGGKVTFELHDDVYPKTCENFRELCKSGEYIRAVFHKVGTDTMTGGSIALGRELDGQPLACGEELTEPSGQWSNQVARLGPPPVIAAVRDSPMFLITHNDEITLDTSYLVFGRVKEGKDIVHAIIREHGRVSNVPSADIIIASCGVESA